MVHHVAFGAEALATVLRASEGAVVVVHAHVHRQIVAIVERFSAGGHWADEICPQLVVGQVSLQMASRLELLIAALKGALKDLARLLLLAGRPLAAESLVRARETEHINLFGILKLSLVGRLLLGACRCEGVLSEALHRGAYTQQG